jgi:CRISPR/Cas system-associated endonuclease Cas3-HD
MTVEGKISLTSSIIRKSIYIIKRIIIIIGEQLGKKEVEELYKDAIVLHLLREGYSEYRAEAEARRRMMRDDML